MDKKIATYSLVIFIVAIFVFVGLFAWFMIFKEQVCAINLNSVDCTEHFRAFLHQKFVH